MDWINEPIPTHYQTPDGTVKRRPRAQIEDDRRGKAFLLWSRDWHLAQAVRGRTLDEVMNAWWKANYTG